MAYVSLYRKYRPQTFDEVVGQEHVTTTLKNAIAAGRVGSGYLFTGTRGTAKTTCARILAKALNCIGEDGTRNAPTPTPCGICGPCKSIAASSFVDVLEMDAASHGKVDDVRDLVASIKFPPMEGRYKVYIIDEAHQLSRDAMDAFLKTLEEPPDRVVFVLATTELDKLPITIASRCQVFEFKRGSVAAISSRLTAVLGFEGVAADPAAVTLVARAADGSYRDSLSLLEQVLAFKPNDVTAQDVSRVLGTVDDDLLTDIVARIAAHDAGGAFAAADAITSAGKDVRQFLRTLSARLRDMLFVTVGAQSGESEISAAARAQVGILPPGTLLRALEILSETERDMRWSNQHRLVLEITLLRLCTLGGGDAAFPTAQHVAPIVQPRPVERTSPPKQPEPAAQTRPAPVAIPAPVETPADVVTTPPPRQQPASEPEPAPAAPAPRVDVIPPAPPSHHPVDETPRDVPSPNFVDSDIDDEDDDVDTDMLDTAEDEEIDSTPVGAVLPVEDADNLLRVQQIPNVPGPFDVTRHDPSKPDLLIRLEKAWQEVINRMSSRGAHSAALIKDATPIAVAGNEITLQFTTKVFYDKLNTNERGRATVEEAISRTLNVEPGSYRVKCILKGMSRERDTSSTPAPISPSSSKSTSSDQPGTQVQDPLLDTVIAVFGGRVVEE